MAELFDLNLVIPDTLQGKTSVKLHDVTWRQIFQVVLAPVGYTFIEDGNIIKIVSNESLTQEPVSTEIFIINYAKAADLQPDLVSLVDATAGGKVVIDARTNSLVITERPSRMKRIRPVIEELDRPTDQVMIESKFVEISNNDIKNIGVNWSSLSGYNVTGSPGPDGLYSYANEHGTTVSSGVTGTSGTNNQSGTTGANSLANGSTNSTSVTSTNGVATNTPSTGTNGTLNNTQTSNAATNLTNTLANNISNTVTGQTQNALEAVFSADQFKLCLLYTSRCV